MIKIKSRIKSKLEIWGEDACRSPRLFNTHPSSLLLLLLLILILISSPQILAQVIGRPPVITTQPTSQIAAVGSDVTFSVGVAPSATPLSYRWKSALRGNIAGATNDLLVFTNVQISALFDLYSVVVANAAGSVTSTGVTFTVIQVLDQSVSVGADVTFGVLLLGPPPFVLQWRLNGQDILGATNRTLVVKTNAQPSDAGGNYSIVVKNALGSATSREAVFTVDPTFTKITTGPVVSDGMNTRGGSWGDYDNDGNLDLFVTVASGTGVNNLLYQNNGDGSFSKATPAKVGSVVGDLTDSAGGSWGDYDNDGFLDLFVGVGAPHGSTAPIFLSDLLYHNNGNGTFTRMTTNEVGVIVDDRSLALGAAWADYDRDGFLDLFVATSTGPPNLLYHNNGNGTFAKVTTGPVVTDRGLSAGCAWGDYDNDGYPDLFVANSMNRQFTSPSAFLYHNNGDGRFTRTSGSIPTGRATNGGAWGDFDNDGDLDLFVTNLGGEDVDPNFLYRNNGDGTFTKLTSGPVVEPVGIGGGGSSSRSASWGDYDNDGFLDLFVANGRATGDSRFPAGQETALSRNNFLYHNNGDGTFAKVTTGSLVNDVNSRAGGRAGGSVGSSWADYDNDGFLDLFVANNGDTGSENDFLYRNNGNGNSWIKIKCVSALSNRSAIGAKVRVQAFYAGAMRWQLREITTGDGFQNSPPPDAHFGLGNATNIDTVRIEWPSGIVQEMHNVASKQFLTVTEQGVAIVPPVQNLVIGSNYVFAAKATFTGPLKYQWRFYGADLVGETNSSLIVKSVTTLQAGEYSVVVRDAAGAVLATSSSALLRSTGAPTIRTQPQSQIALASTDVNLSVGVVPSATALSFQWFKDGSLLPALSLPTLVLTNAQLAASGSYSVVVSNAVGAVTSAVAGVTIVRDSSISGSLGANVTLAFTSGGPPLTSIQWRLNGADIPGATSTRLVITNSQRANVGQYSVVVANAVSSFTNHAGPLVVDPTFTKITTGDAVQATGFSYACSWGDYDNDGYLDLFVGRETTDGGNLLLHNNGSGTFTRITTGGIVKDGAGTWIGLWGDYDNDGDLDLFDAVCCRNTNKLYRNNGDGTFTNIPSATIDLTLADSHSAVWADFDNDGQLDLFVTSSPEFSESRDNFLYHNNGNGSFSRITSGALVTTRGSLNGAAGADYDNDGYVDLFLANESGKNLLYHNNGDGSFSPITSGDIVKDAGNSGGGAWADYDNDGWPDLFVTHQSGRNFLYHNNGDGTFSKITAGDLVNLRGTYYGCAWGDLDNDGYLDLFVTAAGATGNARKNLLFHNNGDGSFTQIRTGSLANDTLNSLGCAWGDYDNDGFLDLYVANGGYNLSPQDNFLYRNNGNSNSWIKFKLVGTVSNRGGIGAKVRVRATIRGRTFWQLLEVSGAGGFQSQNELNPHFGLGNATNIDTVRIEWPSGIVQEMRNVAAKQFLTVVEPPRLRSPTHQADGLVQIDLIGAVGLPIRVDVSTNLLNWTPLITVTNRARLETIVDPAAKNAPQRFYRAVSP